ncbi:MAG: HK97 family phage prohead protease [Holosporaceae bacterium]|jgi:HK97 family phage prohead protease|nr:HK97 family phage prohead protease [Holosporaceae bacterium]
MKFLTPCQHFKSLCDDGEISGYASVFRVADGCGDVVKKGAFKTAVADFKAGKKPKLLWQHDINSPIGVIEELREDDYGLFIRCRLLLEIPRAMEVYHLLKNKAIDGFSIGYRIRDSYHCNNHQYLTDVELLEISVVTFPACGSALVDDVKNDRNVLLSIRALSNKIKRNFR